jgi:hypothetical protein
MNLQEFLSQPTPRTVDEALLEPSRAHVRKIVGLPFYCLLAGFVLMMPVCLWDLNPSQRLSFVACFGSIVFLGIMLPFVLWVRGKISRARTLLREGTAVPAVIERYYMTTRGASMLVVAAQYKNEPWYADVQVPMLGDQCMPLVNQPVLAVMHPTDKLVYGVVLPGFGFFAE